MNEQISAYRIRFELDPDGHFEECNGESRPLSAEEYAKNEYMRDGKPIPYAEYRAYYGNPDRHVYLGAIVETQCACCGTWKSGPSLWWIDFMDDNPEVQCVDQTYELARLNAIPGYLREVARDLFTEAGASVPAAITEGD